MGSEFWLRLRSSVGSRAGATAVEYGLVAAGISLAIIAAVFLIGGDVSDIFGTAQEALAEQGN